MDKEKNLKIDFMKVVVTLLVVIAHSTRMYTGYGAISGYSINMVLKKFTEFIYGFHMPLFFVLSGFVFSICIDNNKYNNKIQFIENKFMRLIVPYILFGVFYIIGKIDFR